MIFSAVPPPVAPVLPVAAPESKAVLFAVLPDAAPESNAVLLAVLPLAAPVLNAELLAVLPLAAPVLKAALLAVFPDAAPVFPVAAPVVPLIYRSADFPDALAPYESTAHCVPPTAFDTQKPAFSLGT